MEMQKIRDWETSADQVELNGTPQLPEKPQPGETYIEDCADGTQKQWLAVQVHAGNTGGRWAYWSPWELKDPQGNSFHPTRWGVGPHPNYKAIADRVFNGDAAHFIGMLAVPYVRRLESTSWVLVSPRMEGPKVIRVIVEKPSERYEKSKEVFDVETGESKQLP